jgi:hypothetical protein
MSLWHPTKPAYPIADNAYDLGSSTLRWRGLYLAGSANVGSLQIAGTTVIDSNRKLQNIASIIQTLLPDADNTYDLGSSTYRWRNLILAGYGNLGSLRIGGTEVISSGRVLANVTADAGIITSGRFPLARLPTSATANRFLVVRTANADPTYDAITAADIPGLDASKIVSGRFTVSRLPDGTSGYVLVGQGSGYDMAWKNISGIAGTITDSQHGTKTGIPFAHHGDWGHYGKIPTSAPTGAAERAYVDSANLYVHDGTSWVLRATKDWNNLINKPSTFPPSTHASTHEYGGTDLVRNLDYLAIRGTTVIDSSRNLTNIASATVSGAANVGSLQISGTTVIDSTTKHLHNALASVRFIESYASGYDTITFEHKPADNIALRIWNATDNYSILDITRDEGNATLKGRMNAVGGYAVGGTTVIDSSRILQSIASVAQSLRPSADNTYDFGSSTYRWRDLYLSGAADVGSLRIGGTVIITSDRMLANIAYLATSLLPYLDNTYDIGASACRIRNLYVAGTANVGSVLPVGGAGSGYVGNSTYYWYAVYSSWAYFANAYPKDGDNTGALGSTERRWAVLYAVTKSAAFKHPLHNPKRYIVFKCVESPKVTVEDWGIAELKNGKAFVGFSEEFVALMSDKTEYAVFLTPEGECNGLYVSKKEFYGFEVKELGNGKSNIRFSWQVKAVRIGDEETPVLEEPTPQFTDQEKDKQLEWMKNRQEADKKKEEDRLNRMKQKIAKYREALGKS